MARSRRSALSIPTTTAEANQSLERIGAIDREATRIEQSLAKKIATLRKAADEVLLPILDEKKKLVLSIEHFANDHRTELLDGDRKSAKLSAGTIGWRLTPPKVTLARGGEKKALETLKKLRLEKYIRTKESVDKEGLLKDRPEITGIRYSQREEFFIEIASAVSDPEASNNVVTLVSNA